MPDDLILPDEADARMGWPPGRAARLAGRGKLPHYQLPDGAIRFAWGELVALVKHHPATDSPPPGKGVAHVR